VGGRFGCLAISRRLRYGVLTAQLRQHALPSCQLASLAAVSPLPLPRHRPHPLLILPSAGQGRPPGVHHQRAGQSPGGCM
jgi:hypothetical protein